MEADFPQDTRTAPPAVTMIYPLVTRSFPNGITHHPTHRHSSAAPQFDGPVSLALALALMIEGPPEEVPGFTSISQQGVVRRCTAYCAENAKKNGLPVNSTATALWHAALKRQGLERGLRREDGSIADWLAGNVVVVLFEQQRQT